MNNCLRCGRDITYTVAPGEANPGGLPERVVEGANEFCCPGCQVAYNTSTADASGIADGTFIRTSEGFKLEKGKLLP